MQKAFKIDKCSPLISAVERGEVHLLAHGRGQYPGIRLKTGKLPGLRSVGVWNAIGPQNWGLPMHRNEGIEICYVLSGQTAFATDTMQSTLRKLLSIYRRNHACHLVDKSGSLKRIIEWGLEKAQANGPLITAHLACLINSVLLTIAEDLSSGIAQGGNDPQGFDQTISQFFKGLEVSVVKAAEPWTVDTIAHACRVGKSYLTTSCREIFNATPSEQVNLIRLHHAGRMLHKESNKSITDIAFEVGFNSSQYFAKRFKKQFGHSPTQHIKTKPPETERAP